MSGSGPAPEVGAPRASAVPVPDRGEELARWLAEAGGDGVVAVLMYGSHLNKASPRADSAYDLVVVVDQYAPFHRALKERGEIHRPLFLFNWAARILPPSVIAFTPDDGRAGMAKCLVIRRDSFQEALGPQPPDHFLMGRMIQKVGLPWVRSPEDEGWVQDCLERAHHGILEWMAPYVEGDFDVASFGARTLEVCYRGEIRPEAGNRSEIIYGTQADYLGAMLAGVFRAGVERGVLERVGSGRYRFARSATPAEARSWRWHFRWSKLRATARWFKHVLTFDNWLPYVTGKVERRTGQRVELTRLEKAVPIIFLWPRVVQVLLSRPDEE